MIRDNELTFHDLLVEVFIVLSPKWEATAKESKEENSTCPNVSWRSAKLLFSHYLWSHVRRRSTEYLYLFIIGNTGTESKIDDFDVPLCIKHHIFKLDVSVANAFTVTVLQCTDDLSVDPSGVVFIHPSVWLGLQEAVSGTASNVFHHQDNLLFGLDSFVEFCDMRMIESLHELDLSTD